MVAENRANRGAGFVDSAAQISVKNAKKVNKFFKVCLNWFKDPGEVETSIFEHITTDHGCIKAFISSHKINSYAFIYIKYAYIPLTIPKCSSC